MQSGSNPQTAFEIAVRKIGQVQALKAEFAKAGEFEENRDRKLKIVCLVLGALCYAMPLALNASHMLLDKWISRNAAFLWPRLR